MIISWTFNLYAILFVGEEVNCPNKALPIAIISTVFSCFFAYAGVSATVTLISPYFLLDDRAPLIHAFRLVGLDWATYIIYIGAIFAISTSLLGN